VPVEMEVRVGSPVGDFLCFCMFCRAVVDVGFDYGCVGARDGGDADAGLRQMVLGQPSTRVVDGDGLRQMVQGQPLTGVLDEDDEQIIRCLEHVRPLDMSFPFFFVWRLRNQVVSSLV
jgi:hypothetical protein